MTTSFGERLGRPATSRALSVAAAAVCFLAVLGGLSLVAGWSSVTGQLHPQLSWWFALAFAAEFASFAGYLFCYRAVAAVRDGPHLTWRRSVRLVAAGFGAFEPKGGAALDAKALRPRN